MLQITKDFVLNNLAVYLVYTVMYTKRGAINVL